MKKNLLSTRAHFFLLSLYHRDAEQRISLPLLHTSFLGTKKRFHHLTTSENLCKVTPINLVHSRFQMAFSVSTKARRGHSTIHIATSRDYDRKKVAAKHEVKLEREHEMLERRMISGVKWSLRAENNNLQQTTTTTNPDRSTGSSLNEYLQREKAKHENINNAKRMGNERIRRSSINNLPKS